MRFIYWDKKKKKKISSDKELKEKNLILIGAETHRDTKMTLRDCIQKPLKQ